MGTAAEPSTPVAGVHLQQPDVCGPGRGEAGEKVNDCYQHVVAYEGAENEFTSLLSDSDLEALRIKVEDHHRRR